MSTSLGSTAYTLCEEVRDGVWDAALPPNGQPSANAAVIGELRRRCPGHSQEEYERAIAQGMSATR